VWGAIDVAAVTTSALDPLSPFFCFRSFSFWCDDGARAMTSMQFLYGHCGQKKCQPTAI